MTELAPSQCYLKPVHDQQQQRAHRMHEQKLGLVGPFAVLMQAAMAAGDTFKCGIADALRLLGLCRALSLLAPRHEAARMLVQSLGAAPC